MYDCTYNNNYNYDNAGARPKNNNRISTAPHGRGAGHRTALETRLWIKKLRREDVKNWARRSVCIILMMMCVESEKATSSEHKTSSATLAPPCDGPAHKLRRQSLRPAGRTQLRSSSSSSTSAAAGAHIQLLSIPQLDVIQRSLKILDVKLQHVQTNCKNEQLTREDIRHTRRVMSENHKVLSTVVPVLSSLQDEVRASRSKHFHLILCFHFIYFI